MPYALPPSLALRTTEKQEKTTKSKKKARKSNNNLCKSKGTSYAIRPATRQTTHHMPYALPPSIALRPTEKQREAKKTKEKQ